MSQQEVIKKLEEALRRLLEGMERDIGEAFPAADETVQHLVRVRLRKFTYVLSRYNESLRASLTPRQLQIAELVAGGMKNQTIAEMLAISPSTVATHLRRVYRKLEVQTRAGVARQITLERN